MNIKRAKQEIRDSIEAYLSKDEFGEYRIPAIRQRPILLMGPPGIGKTQIMEQVARECGIALVSYTITHHTRQSAVGLPFIVKKNYGEEEFSVTEYTMSEIISSVYDKMEKTGLKEGILFIDEINCVSETLAPMMLQFLQGKTFGNQKVPEGWVIVTAGNPPEYNKSVREFDVVTLDRIKKIDVEADFDVWKEYAYQQGIHPAVISYLELRRKNFYRVENTVDGKIFATARGWEDLSRLIQVYEILGKTVDREVVSQYIQHRMIAKDFAGYLALCYKYRTDYKVEDILKGKWDSITLGKIRAASLDEHLSVVSLLNGKLSELFTECCLTDAYLTKLYDYMVYFREDQDSLTAKNLLEKAEADLEKDKKSELLTKQQERIQKRVVSFFENASGLEATGSDKTGSDSGPEGGRSAAAESEVPSSNRNYEFVKVLFESETEAYENRTNEISFTLQNVFDFMEAAFGDSQEMVAFITELNANYYSLWFIRENGSDQYYRHNKGLLFDDRQKMLLGQMEEVENILNNGIK
ncbi:MAG: AAA family ATPase [Ruminococcus sp.]|nr:AAA family ATPase [Ruminococcus sp.]